MKSVVQKNKRDWNDYAQSWARWNHSEQVLRPVLENPSKAFHGTVWQMIQKYVPDLKGKRICVPSSGDNLAVFAFALMGAKVTSCDIAENQLENARRIAEREGLADAIEFVCTDTMQLAAVADSAYDLVYTSNGVHVWLDDLEAMYRNVYRVLKPGGLNIVYEIHPFMRPFTEGVKVIKPYDAVGPFEDENTVNFHWRMQDFLNAMMNSGIRLMHMEEMFSEKDYKQPFWLSMEEIIRGVKVSREEVDRMYDWRQNPAIALPQWMCIAGRKE